MAFDRVKFKDYYGLKKDTFSINPVDDGKAYFGSDKLSDRILGRIEGDFAQARSVPKFYLLGDFGAGKTHTLFHIAYELKNNNRILEDVEPIYVDIAPMGHKERFATVQARLMDAIGLDAIGEAAELFISGLKGDKDKVNGIQALLKFGDVGLRSSQSNVFRNILFGGRQRQLCWDWLRGASLNGSDRELLQVTKTLSKADDFVHVLLNTGVLYQAGMNKKLVYLIDEGEAIRDVTDGDSISEMVFAFRELFDDSNNVLGLIAAIQPESGEEIGEVLSNFAILRRIGGNTGIFDLTSLVREPLDMQKFVDDLLEYLIDPSEAKKICDAEQLECKPEHFPFNEASLLTLADGIQSDPTLQRPAGIIHILATAAIEGWRNRINSEKHIIVTPEIMERVLYPEQG